MNFWKKTATAVASVAAAAAIAAPAVAHAAPTPLDKLQVAGDTIVWTGPGGMHYFAPKNPAADNQLKSFKPNSSRDVYNSALMDSPSGNSETAKAAVLLNRVPETKLTPAQKNEEIAGLLSSVADAVQKETGFGTGDNAKDATFAARSLFNIQVGLIDTARKNGGPEPINHVAYTPGELKGFVTRWAVSAPDDVKEQVYKHAEAMYLAVVDRGQGVDSNQQARVNVASASKDANIYVTRLAAAAQNKGFTEPASKKPAVVSLLTIDKSGTQYADTPVYVDSDTLIPYQK